MPSSEPIEIPDLRALLAEASRPSATVTVPIKQGLREKIEAAEAELEALAESGGTKRMGAKSPTERGRSEGSGTRGRDGCLRAHVHVRGVDALGA